MCILEVGDFLAGVKGNGYGMSNENLLRAEVLSVSYIGNGNYKMRIKVLEHKKQYNCGKTSNVHLYGVQSENRGKLNFKILNKSEEITMTTATQENLIHKGIKVEYDKDIDTSFITIEDNTTIAIAGQIK